MTTFKTVKVDGLDVFCREAGHADAPKLLLLGGFPSSSHQFRNLLPTLEQVPPHQPRLPRLRQHHDA